jgi:hypothetical protein
MMTTEASRLRTRGPRGPVLRARPDLGLVHYRASRRDEAREAWEESRSQEPGDDPQVRAYRHLLEAS